MFATLHKDKLWCGGNIDTDFYTIDIFKESMVEFKLLSIPSGTNYDLYVYNNDDNLVLKSTNSSNSNEYKMQQLKPGRYYVEVKSSSGYHNSSEYHLSISTDDIYYKTYSEENAMAEFGATFVWEPNYKSEITWEESYRFEGEVDGFPEYPLYTAILSNDQHISNITYMESTLYLAGDIGDRFWKLSDYLELMSDQLEPIVAELDKDSQRTDIALDMISNLACGTILAVMPDVLAGGICSGFNLILPNGSNSNPIRQILLDINELESALSQYSVSSNYDINSVYLKTSFNIISRPIYLAGDYSTYVCYKDYSFEIEKIPDRFSGNQGYFGGSFASSDVYDYLYELFPSEND